MPAQPVQVRTNEELAHLRVRARELRGQGYVLREIAEQTGVAIPQLGRWLKGHKKGESGPGLAGLISARGTIDGPPPPAIQREDRITSSRGRRAKVVYEEDRPSDGTECGYVGLTAMAAALVAGLSQRNPRPSAANDRAAASAPTAGMPMVPATGSVRTTSMFEASCGHRLTVPGPGPANYGRQGQCPHGCGLVTLGQHIG